MREWWKALARDRAGKARYKLVLGSCVLSLAIAMSSAAFQVNPLIGGVSRVVHERMAGAFETVETLRRGLGGQN